MNWDAIGAVGDFVSGTGVIVTLGYLAVQVRHARDEVRRTVTQGRLEVTRQLFMANAASGELSELTARMQERLGAPISPFISDVMDQLGFTHAEAFRLFSNMMADWTYVQQVIPYVNELPCAEREAFERSIRARFQPRSSLRFFYDHMRNGGLSPDAVRYVDGVLAQPS